MSTKRIFLGHVLPCISYEDLHAWAAQFGRVIDLQLIRHKGYAFLVGSRSRRRSIDRAIS